jgi:hypothetical protein
MELKLEPLKKEKSKKGIKIIWTNEMVQIITELFPTTYNRELAKLLNVSMRSVIRKARELGLEKEPDFLELRRDEITALATKALPPQPTKGQKGWSVPNSEKTRFKKGNVPPVIKYPDLMEKIQKKRNETIRRDRLRRKYGLSPITKIKNLKWT